MARPEAVLGAVLAGGRSRRMGGIPKSHCRLAGRPLIGHVIGRLGPQVRALLVVANDPLPQELPATLEVRRDRMVGRPGPLAGLLTALDWAAETHPEIAWLLSAPTDTPFLPPDLAVRLRSAVAAGAPAALAASFGRAHPVCALWPVARRGDLEAFLRGGGRRMGDWADRLGAVPVTFDGDPDPLFNINAAADLTRAEALLGG